MKIKQVLEEIKNKDLSKMTNDELLKYKQELLQKSSSSNKINKVGLKKALYYVIGYACGLGIGLGLGRILMSYIYTATLTGLGTNLAIAGLFAIPAIGVSVMYKMAVKNAQKLTQVCNEKISEVDRQIALNDYRRELAASKDAQTADSQAIRTDEGTVFDLNNYNTKKDDKGIER